MAVVKVWVRGSEGVDVSEGTDARGARLVASE